MSFVRRYLEYQFELGKGSFGESGTNAVVVKGVRSLADITRAGSPTWATCSLQIYGMTMSVMRQLSTLGKPLLDGRFNMVTVKAGSDDTGLGVAFKGLINEAWVDMGAAPDGVFIVNASPVVVNALKPLPPQSFPGSADAGVIAASLATLMQYGLENSGVTTRLSNQVLTGSARTQLDQLARAAGFEYALDDALGVLAIWPKGGKREGQTVLINPQTGMVGYPQHTQNNIIVRTIYNPAIGFMKPVEIQSNLLPANGIWNPFSIIHNLSSEYPDGPWFTQLQCSIFGGPVPIGR